MALPNFDGTAFDAAIKQLLNTPSVSEVSQAAIGIVHRKSQEAHQATAAEESRSLAQIALKKREAKAPLPIEEWLNDVIQFPPAAIKFLSDDHPVPAQVNYNAVVRFIAKEHPKFILSHPVIAAVLCRTAVLEGIKTVEGIEDFTKEKRTVYANATIQLPILKSLRNGGSDTTGTQRQGYDLVAAATNFIMELRRPTDEEKARMVSNISLKKPLPEYPAEPTANERARARLESIQRGTLAL